jgi:hypothetical protein
MTEDLQAELSIIKIPNTKEDWDFRSPITRKPTLPVMIKINDDFCGGEIGRAHV